MREMKKKGIYILVSTGAIIAFTIFATTRSSFRRTTLGRIARWCLGDGIVAQRADDLAEDIEKKIGAVKLQAWCEETMMRYKANELLTDGNSPYWSAGDITLADEEIPEFIKNIWPKPPVHRPDVSIGIHKNAELNYIAISWYQYGVIIRPRGYIAAPPSNSFDYTYQRQVKPGICVYVKDT
jgi:hypothetical protein